MRKFVQAIGLCQLSCVKPTVAWPESWSSHARFALKLNRQKSLVLYAPDRFQTGHMNRISLANYNNR